MCTRLGSANACPSTIIVPETLMMNRYRFTGSGVADQSAAARTSTDAASVLTFLLSTLARSRSALPSFITESSCGRHTMNRVSARRTYPRGPMVSTAPTRAYCPASSSGRTTRDTRSLASPASSPSIMRMASKPVSDSAE